MKRVVLLFLLLYGFKSNLSAQEEKQVADSLNLAYTDSLFKVLPEVMIIGERPLVRADQGKLVYDLPQLVAGLPVENAFDAMKNLPGVVEQNGMLTLAGQKVAVIINGKVTALSGEYLNHFLKTIPVGRIEKAEVMYAAPASYQVRGPMINLVLKSNTKQKDLLQGELASFYYQKHYESLEERVSVLFSKKKLFTDLLYSYSYGRGRTETDKEAIHTLADGSVHTMDLKNLSTNCYNTHRIRWGSDYTFSKNHQLSLIYTGSFTDSKGRAETSGVQRSSTNKDSDSKLHNVQLDYQTPFGMKAGGAFTYYTSPRTQLLHSIMGTQTLYFLSKDNQRINLWKLYAGQEHSLGRGWRVNYGAVYTTTLDRSYQHYYDPETLTPLPGNQMESRRHERTLNIYAGWSKSFGKKLTANMSLAMEKYHTDRWNEWSFYPTANLTYIPTPGQVLQLSVSSDKKYPAYWSVQEATSYLDSYSEIQGNPLLKSEATYKTSFNYILKNKYVFSLYYSHTKDKAMQTLYQSPERLAEIYKFVNFDFSRQAGMVVAVPVKIKKWLNSRFTAIGLYYRQKDSDFWDTSFDRKLYTFVLTMNNTFTLSARPDIKFTLSGFYQNRAIQGIYDLPCSGYLNASLRYALCKEKLLLTFSCDDIFNTSTISPRIRFERQHVTNHYSQRTRKLGLSAIYKFGGYKEKKREEVDTSRFK